MKIFNPTIKFLSKIILLSLIIASVVFACKDNSDVNIIKKTPQELGLGGTSYLKFENISLDHVNANKYTSLPGEGYEKAINIFSTEISSNSMSSIINILQKKTEGYTTNVRQKPMEIVFYLKDATFETLEMENIEGFSLFVPQQQGNIKHILFKKQEDKLGKYNIDGDYTTDVLLNEIRYNNLSYIAGTILKNNDNVNWLRYRDIEELSYFKPNSTVTNSNNLAKIALNKSHFLLVGKAANFDCKQCNVQAEGYCYYDAQANRDLCNMAGIDCLLEKSIEEGKNNKSSLRIANIIDTDEIRDIRDNYASKTSKGRDYIDYYYKISQISEVFDSIDSKNALEHLVVAQELINIFEKLSSGEKNDVIIDNTSKEKYINLISKYKNVTKNAEFQEILKTIELDVERLTSKNRNDVIKYIQ